MCVFIASGGMGEVYEAYDERLRSRLALKTVRPDVVSEEGALERFKREILIARGVSHENLCRVFDFVEHQTGESKYAECIPCLTMELLEGESLADLLARKRPLGQPETLSTVHQISEGLAVLHGSGIIHRDLKPSNIMIVPRKSGTSRVVVTDFGLAKADESEVDLFQSHPGFQAGAPYFHGS